MYREHYICTNVDGIINLFLIKKIEKKIYKTV